MASVPELLLDAFYELVDKDFRTFHWYLCSKVVEGFPHIPKARLDGVDREGTVDILVQTYGYDDAVTVTDIILTKMKQKLTADTLKKKYEEVQSNQTPKEITHHAIQDKLKSTLREKYQNIYQGNADEGENVYLNNIYTKLHVIEGAWGGLSEEHQTRQQRFNHVTAGGTVIEVGDIFKPNPNQDKRIRTVLTLGIPGVGKTVCTQKFILSWAEGEENQYITFIFPLPFRELNPNIDDKDYSLMQLLHKFFPDTKPLETLGKESQVLFIFDGLDETLLPLNFKLNKVLRDETESASLDVLITNLITGDLLCNSLVWITSRPAAVSDIPRKHVHQWTEIKGFAEKQREEYFRRHLCDDDLAIRILNHVDSSKSLCVMCQIPVFCWITVTVMKKMLCDNLTGNMPNTLTEMYAYLLLCQTDKMRERQNPVQSDCVVLKLAKLAYHQLEKGNLIFYEADLKECEMDVREATVYSGVCTKLFVMEGRRKQEVFSFVHLTVQEFLAAVYAHHSYMQRKDNILLGNLKRMSRRLFPKSVFKFHQTAIEKALASKDGRWDLFLRFLLGLSLKSNQELLGRILHLEAEGDEDVARTVQFIKEKIKEEPVAKLNLFHCLSELKDESLVQEIQQFVSSGTLAAKNLSPVQWSALTFELMTSEATKKFDLKKYIRSEEGVVKLLPVITSSTHALLNDCKLTETCCQLLASALNSTSSHLIEVDLSDNSLKDSGVKELSVGLSSPNCKLKKLRLHSCKLEGGCCEALGVALSSESTQLRELDLSANDFQKTGLKTLTMGLRSHHCKLETLRLNQCKLQGGFCEDLAALLSSGSSQLKNLDLSNNSVKDSGVYQLTAGLKSPHCRLETLSLSCCGLTHKCCDPIGSALSCSTTHLKELDLGRNNLQGPDFQLLYAGLRSPHCKLERLRTNDGSLQKCCSDFASIIGSDTSCMIELDLSGNDLQDSEVKLLSAGLARAHCKLETLRLSFCGVTVEGCGYLASALSSNPSHLRQLDLSYNHLQDSGVKLLAVHRDNPLCKLEILSVEHNAECYLKSTLKNYACTLTLNKDTAAKSLFVCDGRKQVTWMRMEQPYPDHPERFETVSQVLCRQALTQRHYWEVEWRGSWVDVAVAMRGIRRKGGPYVCGFGDTDQSWTLYCSEDHYSAKHDDRTEEIPPPVSHSHRVGVYLDWPGGTLSFYSVSSGSLSHLHTFYSTFTEPLYAGFGMEKDDSSVTICPEEAIPEISHSAVVQSQ